MRLYKEERRTIEKQYTGACECTCIKKERTIEKQNTGACECACITNTLH